MSKSKKEVASIVSGMGVFVGFISNLVELVKKFGGTIEDIYKLATPEGIAKMEAIARLIVGEAEEAKKQILRLIIGNGHILAAADGTKVISNAKDMFTAGIDSDFVNWKANKSGSATEAIPVCVYEMVEDATYSQMFSSLAADVRKLCLTQHQILNFVERYRSSLRTDGYATFFLFESNGELFVADVHVGDGGSLIVGVDRFGGSIVWSAENRRRLVVPQLAL